VGGDHDGVIFNDFVGLNSNIYEPITASDNNLGYPGTSLEFRYMGGGHDADRGVALTSGHELYLLNGILHHRNGPYQHPMWKQYRGAEHPVARNFRLNNTMSVDSTHPNAIRFAAQKRAEEFEKDNIPSKLPGSRPGDHINKTEFANLKRYYEPALVTKYKPLIYELGIDAEPGGIYTPKTIKARQSLTNQVTFFTNDELNASLKIASGDPTTGSAQGFDRPKHKYYSALHLAAAHNGKLYTYTETLFPKGINTYREFKLGRPNYEEISGEGDNGYDRNIGSDGLRSFWKDDQGGGKLAVSDGTTRLRTDQSARNATDRSGFAYGQRVAGFHGRYYNPGDFPSSDMWPPRHVFNRPVAIATIAVADGDAASGMTEKEHITIISATGTTKRYVITNAASDDTTTTGTVLSDSANTDTGAGTAGPAEDGGIAVSIDLSSATQNDFLVQLKAAIEHANGHAGQIHVSAVPTEADGAQLIRLWQDEGGTAGNTTITTDISQVTKVNFAGGDDPPWNRDIDIVIDGGIVANAINVLTSSGVLVTGSDSNNNKTLLLQPSGAFCQFEMYNLYQVGCLSMHPLDPRQDIYDSPGKLTSSVGGKGLSIGITPQTVTSSLRTNLFTDEQAAAAANNFSTGSAGELVYSSKPEIFYWTARSNGWPATMVPGLGQWDGFYYNHSSLQYHRHTFPYNSPFWATHKIRNRNPMYDSFNDFIGDELKYLGRDYSIVPEYKSHEHLEHYYEKGHYETLAPGFDLDDTSFIQDNNILFTPTAHGRIIRNLGNDIPLDAVKQNFLNLVGGDVTSSSDFNNLYAAGGLATTFYDYDPVNATTAYTSDLDYSYKAMASSVEFYEKYSHTDTTKDFSNLLDQNNKGFKNDIDTIPFQIEFTVRGIKKLLPYNGFYPVNRTAQLGHMLAFAYSGLLDGQNITAANRGDDGEIGTYVYGPNTAFLDHPEARMQTFLEPLMAPGVLYNSIKSGIAVDYPIYAGTNTAQPYYYLPKAFITASALSESMPAAAAFYEERIDSKASASFNYGGMWMMGNSRSTPSILNSRPTHRLPFEAIMDPSILVGALKKSPGSTESKYLYLTTDFMDFDRSDIGDVTASSPDYNPKADLHPNSRSPHPGVAVPAFQPRITFKSDVLGKPTPKILKYKSAVNNFLCEMMDFFLDDIDAGAPGVKLPIIASHPRANFEPIAKVSYYMDVSLRMGKYQVMAEGPRHASMGGGSPVDNEFTRNAMMRGYLYGPPIEVVPHVSTVGTTVASETETFPDGVGGDATVTIVTSSIDKEDYQSYYGANLQDPAYQAFTPPYFYGRSSYYLTYTIATTTANQVTTVQEALDVALDTTSDAVSLFYETYDTGAYKGDPDALCLVAPSKFSVSAGSSTRTKVPASLEISPKALLISKENSDVQHYVSYVAPKWVCPVLDFSSSVSLAKDREYDAAQGKFVEKSNTLTNTYHDVTTGKGLWGGYGTDPYDYDAMEKINAPVAQQDKGIYMSVGYPFAARQMAAPAAATYVDYLSPDKEDFYSHTAAGMPAEEDFYLTSSLASALGFGSKSTPIGRFANQKKIREAIVLIPYFEEPINVQPGPAFHFETFHHEIGEWSMNPGDPQILQDIYKTREIIAGKHFLPINRYVFESILSVYLSENPSWFEGEGTFGTDSPTSIYDALNTDVGKMIRTIAGISPEINPITKTTMETPGLQLPPEFDFIFNKSIDPFQMIVIPVDHTLYKQELIDIYQGVMPKSSVDVEKILQSMIVNPAIAPHGVHDWYPKHYSTEDNIIHGQSSEVMELDSLAFASFLSPAVFTQHTADLGLVSSDSLPNFIKNSRDFYKNLKFMVFKAKQRAKKDYPIYRKKQIAKYVRDKRLASPLFSSDQIDRYLATVCSTEVQGANWPYDYFSLIQSAKIDISFKVLE
jgi:hypothetical protein